MNKINKFYIPPLILLVIILVNFLFFNDSPEQSPASSVLGSLHNAQAYVFPVLESTYLPLLKPNIGDPEINAKSAVVFDTRSSRVLFSKNPDQRLPIASLTKILTAVIALEIFDINEVVTISNDSVRVDGEKKDLYEGEKLTVNQLLNMLLISSSNDAAYALANHAKSKGIDFVNLMNEKTTSLGMYNTFFIDPAGLDDGAYSTVNDLKKLIEYTSKLDLIWQITAQDKYEFESFEGGIKHTDENTNQLLGMVPYIVGGKTGQTEGALGCMILMVNVPHQPTNIVSVILGSKDRFADTQKLIDWVDQSYRWE